MKLIASQLSGYTLIAYRVSQLPKVYKIFFETLKNYSPLNSIVVKLLLSFWETQKLKSSFTTFGISHKNELLILNG